MTRISNRRIVRAKLVPSGGSFSSKNVKTETVDLDTQLNDGDVLVRNIYLALDPMIFFSFMEHGFSSPIGDVITGIGIGEVIDSKNSAYPTKSIVLGFGIGWEQYTRLSNPQTLWVIPDAHNTKIPITEYANALGVNGLTAYAATETLIKYKEGQVVYVSSAAGPVGAFFAIIAKRHGAFVIGSAGTDEKVDYLVNDLGLDAAFNYKTKDTREELDRAAPNGIDIYIDMVGGETLDIAIEKLKQNGQIVAIGNMSSLAANATPYVPKNHIYIVMKALTINGFTATPYLNKFQEFWKEYAPLVASKEIKGQKLTVINGIENAGQAFAEYMDGKYYGKVLVEVATL
ncbi:hypothetical protein BGZ76_002135 [Entomortierella beljakovae]|nr:hypothetical protein BGZ76_002135 [Entomortierella beljakovae]